MKHCLNTTLACIIVCTATFVSAQHKIDIIDADELSSVDRHGKLMTKLSGDVKFRHDSGIMYCDSAYYDKANNSMEALSSVKAVLKDGVVLYADRLLYYGANKTLELYDNITLEQNNAKLQTDRMTYYREEHYGSFYGGGVMTRETDTLSCKSGYYYPDTNLFIGKGDVVLRSRDFIMNTNVLHYNTEEETAYLQDSTWIENVDSSRIFAERGYMNTISNTMFLYQNASLADTTYTLTADTIYYSELADSGWAKCAVNMTMKDTSMYAYGDHSTFSKQRHKSLLYGDPYVIYYMGEDTLLMFADTFRTVGDSGNSIRLMTAYKNASTYMANMQSRADSVVYDLVDSILVLYSDPIIWSDSSQLSGDTITLFMRGSQLDSVYVSEHCFMIMQEDAIFFNQLKGRHLQGKLKNNQLVKITILGNAESLFFVKDAGEYKGMNQTTSKQLEVWLTDNKPKKVKLSMNGEGEFHPMFEIYYENNRLTDFKWQPELKPPNYLKPPPSEHKD